MTALPDPTLLRQLLLEHYDAHRRELPWRESQEPYRVWVSEIMLQQTRVETVIPYYDRWMERFPTVEALAEADEEPVLKAWEGLGYYSRARNLHRSALIVRERLGGVLPQDSRGLKTLPGIGEYSAGAIASIAYGEVVPAVDGNVRRVLSRLFDLEDPADASLRKRAGELVDLRPASKRRPRVRSVSYAVVVAVNSADELLMVRRPPDGLLGGLWEFPAVEIGAEDSVPRGGALDVGSRLGERCRARLEGLGVQLAPQTDRFGVLPEVRHAFTHLKAVYRPVSVVGVDERASSDRPTPSDGLAPREQAWVSPEQAEHLPLPVAQRKIMELARGALATPASTR
jgi:A/G-specific adenine glycosylase